MSQNWKENQWVYVSETIGLTQTKEKQPYNLKRVQAQKKKIA